MKRLFDTNVLIDYLHGVDNAVKLVEQPGQRSVSVITLTEMVYGSHKTSQPKRYLDQFEEFLRVYEFEILALDLKIATQAGEVLALFEKKGTRLSEYDAMIAATSICFNLPLVTFDKKLAQFLGEKSNY